MSKVEIAIFIAFVASAVVSARYMGQLDGRLTAIETSRDYISIKDEQRAAIALIEQSARASMDSIREAESAGLTKFSQFDERLQEVEVFVTRERTHLVEPVEAPGASPWGLWKGAAFCPANHYVCGLEQKVEPTQGKGDDTATNSVRMYCCPL